METKFIPASLKATDIKARRESPGNVSPMHPLADGEQQTAQNCSSPSATEFSITIYPAILAGL